MNWQERSSDSRVDCSDDKGALMSDIRRAELMRNIHPSATAITSIKKEFA
jgi:hypothetical protein